MTDDLVKRLRKRQEFEFIDGHKRVEWEDEDALEAADRIEQLESQLKFLAKDLDNHCLEIYRLRKIVFEISCVKKETSDD